LNILVNADAAAARTACTTMPFPRNRLSELDKDMPMKIAT